MKVTPKTRLTLEFKKKWFSRGDVITSEDRKNEFVVLKTEYSDVVVVWIGSGSTEINKEIFSEGTTWYKTGHMFLEGDNDYPLPNYDAKELKKSEIKGIK